MEEAGIIRNWRIVEHHSIKHSRQHPKGYEVVRVEAEFIRNGDWEKEFCRPQYHPGDEGYESEGYHNEWTVLSEVPKREYRKIVL